MSDQWRKRAGENWPAGKSFNTNSTEQNTDSSCQSQTQKNTHHANGYRTSARGGRSPTTDSHSRGAHQHQAKEETGRQGQRRRPHLPEPKKGKKGCRAPAQICGKSWQRWRPIRIEGDEKRKREHHKTTKRKEVTALDSQTTRERASMEQQHAGSQPPLCSGEGQRTEVEGCGQENLSGEKVCQGERQLLSNTLIDLSPCLQEGLSSILSQLRHLLLHPPPFGLGFPLAIGRRISDSLLLDIILSLRTFPPSETFPPFDPMEPTCTASQWTSEEADEVLTCLEEMPPDMQTFLTDLFAEAQSPNV